MTPKVGQAVLFFNFVEEEQNPAVGSGPYVAMVTEVWSAFCVNLKVWRAPGDMIEVTSITHEECIPRSDYQGRCWVYPGSVSVHGTKAEEHQDSDYQFYSGRHDLQIEDVTPQLDEAIAAVEGLQAAECYVLGQMEKVCLDEDIEVDPRWSNIARTHIEQGFMAMNRAILSPETEG